MRATDGLQTTTTLGSVNHDGQAFSLGLSLEMCLPRLQQDEHLPDQIEAYVHQAGLEVQRRLFQVLIEKADQELVPAPARQRRRRHPAAGDTALHIQDDLRQGHRSAVADQPQSRRHDGDTVGDRLEHTPPARHHPESPGRGL